MPPCGDSYHLPEGLFYLEAQEDCCGELPCEQVLKDALYVHLSISIRYDLYYYHPPLLSFYKKQQ